MKFIIYAFFLICNITQADTIEHYMNIANNIPRMEMKADSESQAWARSARNVLLLTCDSIADTLLLANNAAKQKGSAIFCMPNNGKIDPSFLNELIQTTYRELNDINKNNKTVSEIALLGINKTYPCNKSVINNTKPNEDLIRKN